MQQGRWVSYIYRYRNNIRCENAGFIKVQRISHRANDEARIQIGMKIYKKKACKCMAYLIYNGDSARYLTDIYFKPEERDTIMKRVEIPWDNPLSEGRTFDDYDGILFVSDDGELLTGMWKEYPVIPDNIKPYNSELLSQKATVEAAEELTNIKMPSGDRVLTSGHADNALPVPEPVVAAIAESLAGVDTIAESQAGIETISVQENVAEPAASVEQQEGLVFGINEHKGKNSCLDMLSTYPKLPTFADSQFIECVKIEPQDIGKLSMSNWKLGVNSFLSHGYYRYRYIMLGKVKLGKREKYVIGVPGVFTNKEKYLANMFGFGLFVPVKRTKILTGNFGYWISEVLSE